MGRFYPPLQGIRFIRGSRSWKRGSSRRGLSDPPPMNMTLFSFLKTCAREMKLSIRESRMDTYEGEWSQDNLGYPT